MDINVYIGAYLLDVLFFLSEKRVEVLLVHDLNISLAFALLVLQRAVQQQNARVLDAAAHLRVRHILVEHHSVEHATIGKLLNQFWKFCF